MPAPQPSRIPTSSYRLQFRPGFTFRDAAELIPYLASLGITECYSSPLLAACPNSSHGYDICDHSRLNPVYGGEEGFAAFAEALASHGMGLILDFVPNHMGIDPAANQWWRDVLENGPSSLFARYFDIDWDPVKTELQGKLLLPILGDQYGSVLESGQLRLQFQDGAFSLQYFKRNLPLNPRQMRQLLEHNLEGLQGQEALEAPDLREFMSILFQLEHMPAYTETDLQRVLDRHREKSVVQERLAQLVADSERIQRHIEENVRVFNGEPGNPGSFDLLHGLLDAQAYRLSYWRTALHEINYRRFFDVNELAAIRMEDREIFDAAHGLVLELIRKGIVTGLRLDHIDGLFDPREYFDRLIAACGERAIYVVGEKVLTAGEPLRQDWSIHGTTGYDFLNDLNGLFVDSRKAPAFRRLYERMGGSTERFADIAYESRRLIITTSMVSELNMLARELNRISEVNRGFRDFTLSSLQEALREVVACFPNYRTYCTAKGWDEFDQKTVDTAVAQALRRNPAMEASIFEFLRQLLLPMPGTVLPENQYERGVQFAMKFQQYTGPVQAKGLEDTAFYSYGVLLSLNEVGGDPAQFGRSVEEFHRANQERRRSWPLAMLATSTHDAKRGEDTRARLNVLSEIAEEWRAGVFRWARANAGMRVEVDGSAAPDRADEYIFYQSLIGSWPPGLEEPDAEYVERIHQFMLKAIREKKEHTSWINPSEAYETAISGFVRRTLTGSRSERFLRSFVPFAHRVARLGMLNSLSQAVLKIVSPGVPDFYQGTELWDLSLVDPDNRAPVDYRKRRALLDQMEPLLADSAGAEVGTAVSEMLRNWQDGRIKLYATARALRLRKQHAAVFLDGEYVPLAAEGERKDHVVAFARILGDQNVLVVAPRLVAGLTGEEPRLPLGREIWDRNTIMLPHNLAGHGFRNVLTGEEVEPIRGEGRAQLLLADALRVLPVAILKGKGR